jgi:hypothetical protein
VLQAPVQHKCVQKYQQKWLISSVQAFGTIPGN